MSIPVVDPQDPVLINVTVQINPLPVDLTRRFMIVSAGDTNITTNTYKAVNRSDYASYFTSTVGNKTYQWLIAFFAQAPGSTAYIFEGGPVVATAITNLTTFINAQTAPMYKYSCPTSFYGNVAFAALINSYNGVTTSTYFSTEITNGVDPSADPKFTPLAGAKAFCPFYGSGVSGESIDGASTGVMASPKYDLSATNPNTMLNYSQITGITAPVLSFSLRNTLNALGINYAGSINGIVTIFNGRYADLNAWDYWYAWDWFQLNAISNLTAAIVNGANNPQARIAYDQNGIDSVKGTLNAVATKGQSFGVVTDFGASYDFIKGVITNEGSFSAIAFFPYIAANPSNYVAGIYDGLSGYVLIGRFIRQVVFNVTIN